MVCVVDCDGFAVGSKFKRCNDEGERFSYDTSPPNNNVFLTAVL